MPAIQTTDLDGLKCITTGQLGDLFGVKMPIDFMQLTLKIQPYTRDRATYYWKVEDLPSIGKRWQDHIDRCLAAAPKP